MAETPDCFAANSDKVSAYTIASYVKTLCSWLGKVTIQPRKNIAWREIRSYCGYLEVDREVLSFFLLD